MLRDTTIGAPAGNIRLLAQLGLAVDYSVTDIEGLIRLVDSGTPPIVFLRTGELPYWRHQTDHAVVVVGYDDTAQLIFVNDPYHMAVPIAVPQGDLELTWLERDYYYAAISRPQ